MAVGLLMILSACSSDTSDDEGYSVISDSVWEAVQQNRADPPKPLVITQVLLDRTNEGVLLVEPDLVERGDLLRRVVRRADKYPGTLEVWRASDAAQVVLRDGVLVATRGIGGDILSSDASQTLSLLGMLQEGAAKRTVFVRAGDMSTQRLDFDCVIADRGVESLVLVERPIALRAFRETCSNDAFDIINDYWIEPNSRLVRKSRQWAGPKLEYFVITLLKN